MACNALVSLDILEGWSPSKWPKIGLEMGVTKHLLTGIILQVPSVKSDISPENRPKLPQQEMTPLPTIWNF